MSVLNSDQIATLIYQVGGFGPGPYKESEEAKVKAKVEKWLDTAIAIALAESGGDTDAKNGSSTASGLWQIMASVHADKINSAIATRGNVTGDPDGYKPTVFDPWVNTEVAKQVYKAAGNKWTPWEVFNTGAYKAHSGHGKAAYAYLADPAHKATIATRSWAAIAGQPGKSYDGGIVEEVAQAGQAASSTAERVLSSVTGVIKDAGMTAGAFLLAVILLIIGVWFLLSRTKAFEQATTIASVIPAGKAAKAVT